MPRITNKSTGVSFRFDADSGPAVRRLAEALAAMPSLEPDVAPAHRRHTFVLRDLTRVARQATALHLPRPATRHPQTGDPQWSDVEAPLLSFLMVSQAVVQAHTLATAAAPPRTGVLSVVRAGPGTLVHPALLNNASLGALALADPGAARQPVRFGSLLQAEPTAMAVFHLDVTVGVFFAADGALQPDVQVVHSALSGAPLLCCVCRAEVTAAATCSRCKGTLCEACVPLGLQGQANPCTLCLRAAAAQ